MFNGDGATQSTNGRLTSSTAFAAVVGWRSAWSTKVPATTRAGYYTAAMDLQDPVAMAQTPVPQGIGYLTLKIAKAGSVALVGRTSDGTPIAFTSHLGPNGEVLVYQAMYRGLGSTVGALTLTPGGTLAENTATGTVTWLRPSTTSRAYPAGFGPLNLGVEGKYMAASSTSTVLGLPTLSADARLVFTEGGLAGATITPNVTFNYAAGYKVKLPAAGTAANPGKVTLSINKATGAISGTFKLTADGATRAATFSGSIVRLTDGGIKGVGYFLLPQSAATIPAPILSGQVLLLQ